MNIRKTIIILPILFLIGCKQANMPEMDYIYEEGITEGLTPADMPEAISIGEFYEVTYPIVYMQEAKRLCERRTAIINTFSKDKEAGLPTVETDMKLDSVVLITKRLKLIADTLQMVHHGYDLPNSHRKARTLKLQFPGDFQPENMTFVYDANGEKVVTTLDEMNSEILYYLTNEGEFGLDEIDW